MTAAETALDLAHLRRWIGRTCEATDEVTAFPLAGLAAMLDREEPRPRPGDPVPPGGHWLYFLALDRQSALTADGKLAAGDFLPPIPFPRRTWAGGRLAFHEPLRVGDALRRVSRIADVALKQGRGGEMVLLKVRHEIYRGDRLLLVEDHTTICRPPVHGPAALPRREPAPADAPWRRTVTPDPVFLFRYSALTFNAHRNHFDRPFATEVEGYPGLTVHAQLTATLLLELCREHLPGRPVRACSYRAMAPLFDSAPFTVGGGPPGPDGVARLWAANPEGALAMTATAEFGEG